jgi:hypothetical protein
LTCNIYATLLPMILRHFLLWKAYTKFSAVLKIWSSFLEYLIPLYAIYKYMSYFSIINVYLIVNIIKVFGSYIQEKLRGSDIFYLRCVKQNADSVNTPEYYAFQLEQEGVTTVLRYANLSEKEKEERG